MINIIIRTSGRPRYFKSCVASIERQTYRDYRIIVGMDTPETYADKYHPFRYPRTKSNGTFLQLKETRTLHFPYNLYLNTLMTKCEPGWVMFLDDDDEFFGSNALMDIIHHLKVTTDVPFWRVRINNRVVPSNENFGKRPVVKDVSCIGFAFHTDYIPLMQFDPYKQADYRIANRLFSILNPVWIDKVLTQTQRREGIGRGLRQDKI